MNFGVYLPPQAEDGKVPVIYWLSGELTVIFLYTEHINWYSITLSNLQDILKRIHIAYQSESIGNLTS